MGGKYLTTPSHVQEPDVNKPLLCGAIVGGRGNPGSTCDAVHDGDTAYDDEMNLTIVPTLRFVSRVNESCLSVGPPYSRSLMLLSGSMPIARRNALMLCCVPFDLMTLGRLMRTRLMSSLCTSRNDTLLLLIC